MKLSDIIVSTSIVLSILTVFVSVAMFFIIDEPHNITAGVGLFIGAFVIAGTGLSMGHYIAARGNGSI